MLRQIILPAMTGALAFTAIACEPKLPPNPRPNGGASPSAEIARPTSAEIGGDLFPATAVAPRPPVATADAGGVPIDAILVKGCQVTLPRTENVPSKNDGKLLEYCTEFDPAHETVAESDIVIHPRTKKQYRRLKVGDTVKKDQLIAIMDDTVPHANFDIAVATVKASEAKLKANVEIRKAADAEYDMTFGLRQKGIAPEAELRRAGAQRDRALAEVAEAEGQMGKSKEELKKAEVILQEHEIRSDIAGEVKRFYRRAGESVKALDPVAEIQNLETMRIEGMVDVHHLMLGAKLRQGQSLPKVIVERAEQIANERSLEGGHRQPVRAVAVSKDPRRPLIVSASDDKTVGVWDRQTGQQVASWRHVAPVRAVACTSKTAEANLCLSGADDGVARIWDLSNPTAGNPLREMKGRHQQQIVFAAFAPNGQTAATADNREIIIWDVGTGEMKYRISNPHNGPVTSLQFTPQSTLVTAGRDRTIRIWKLGDKGAAPETVIEHRTGDVPVLGVSPDGQRVLFDQDRALNVLSIADQRTEGVLHAPSDTTQFSTFALFSPDGRLILAAGTSDNPLQVWRAPAEGSRATMLRRLPVGPSSAPTCAAFAPDGSFAVTGTQDNRVLVWGLPDEQETKRQITATIDYVDKSIESADRKVRIWADKLVIPQGVRLLAGETVTLVITPQGSK
jgi:biotin carboxyl carrier protein